MRFHWVQQVFKFSHEIISGDSYPLGTIISKKLESFSGRRWGLGRSLRQKSLSWSRPLPCISSWDNAWHCTFPVGQDIPQKPEKSSMLSTAERNVWDAVVVARGDNSAYGWNMSLNLWHRWENCNQIYKPASEITWDLPGQKPSLHSRVLPYAEGNFTKNWWNGFLTSAPV
jgi:hypothetical protein